MERSTAVKEFLVAAVNPLRVKRRLAALREELAQLEGLFPSLVNGAGPVKRTGNGKVRRRKPRKPQATRDGQQGAPRGGHIGNPNRAAGLGDKVLALMPKGGALVTSEQVVPLLEEQGYPFLHEDRVSRLAVVRATFSRLIDKGLVHKADKGQYRRL